jgi:alpha-tubulin suppressor-like RCC1 family protein
MRAPLRRLLLCAVAAHALFACSVLTDYALGRSEPTAPGVDAAPPDVESADVAVDAPVVRCSERPCVTQIAASGAATCALLEGGAVKCWGFNTTGVVGTALREAKVDVPTAIALDGPADEIAMGGWGREWPTACARRGGRIDCWGDDGSFKLGRGTDAAPGGFVPVPAPVANMSTAIGGIGIGTERVCARVAGDALSCWGTAYDDARELVATPMASPKPVKQVVGGRAHHCVLLDSEEVACAGYFAWFKPLWNDAGYKKGPGTVALQIVAGLSGIAQISAQQTHVCALKRTGAVLCWGRNRRGELGRGTTEDLSTIPAPVALPVAAKAIGSGANHSCAVLADDSVWCWGRNELKTDDTADAGLVFSGQCGAPASGPLDAIVPTPRRIAGLPAGAVSAVVGGYAHSCALMESGAVYCWGTNLHGELGLASGSAPDAGDVLPHPTAARVVL